MKPATPFVANFSWKDLNRWWQKKEVTPLKSSLEPASLFGLLRQQVWGVNLQECEPLKGSCSTESPPVQQLVAASLELPALLIGSSTLESPLLDQQLLTGYRTVGSSLWVLWDFELVKSWGTAGIPHKGVFQLGGNTYITCISYIYWTNALVPLPISVMKRTDKRVYSESYLKSTLWGGGVEVSGSWSSWVTSKSPWGSSDQRMLLLSSPFSTCAV